MKFNVFSFVGKTIVTDFVLLQLVNGFTVINSSYAIVQLLVFIETGKLPRQVGPFLTNRNEKG